MQRNVRNVIGDDVWSWWEDRVARGEEATIKNRLLNPQKRVPSKEQSNFNCKNCMRWYYEIINDMIFVIVCLFILNQHITKELMFVNICINFIEYILWSSST
jgi:hypothetical protein